MKYQLRVRPAADSDVDAAADYIAQHSLGAALKFYDAVDLTYRQLRDHPKRWRLYEIGHPRLTDLRKRSVETFRSYLVFYRIDGAVVEIIRVLHGARDLPSILDNG